ncbi:MAG TPA: flagellar hook-basal body complex protein, partial [Planctomycetaceae bacterium]
MGLASALNTSWTGISLSSTKINVLGNNVANAGTTGFKQSNVSFATLLSQTLSTGSAPSSTNAGTNPLQHGFGGLVASVTPDFTQGGLATTNSPTNLAIQGNGFFVVQDNTGTGQLYTRDGTFGLNSANQLTTSNGQSVLGYGVDNNFNIVAGGLTPLQIPLGTLQEAQQTKAIQMSGALSPQGQIATQGTKQTSVSLTDQSTSAAAGAGSLLTNLLQPASAAPTTPLFAAGQTITFAPTIGGQALAARSLTVTGGSTVSDL